MAAKATCSRCSSPLYRGKVKCTACGHWNIVAPNATEGVIRLSDAKESHLARYKTGPWDICFGPARKDPTSQKFIGENGIVNSSVTLIGGQPGAGKSTLSLQLVEAIADSLNRDALYVLSEENTSQVKDRAVRLGLKHIDHVLTYSTLDGSGQEVSFEGILKKFKPAAVVVDSLNGLTTDLPQQVKYCKVFKEYASLYSMPIVVIDQVTKDSDFAGLMSLQHAVDTLITLNIIENEEIRVMRTVKNRFGTAPLEIYFEMTEKRGLVLKLFGDSEDEEEVS